VPSKASPFLSVIVPAYNESGRLGSTLQEILIYLKKMKKSFELIVVDDGSSDRTVQIASDLAKKDRRLRLLKNAVNQGKGSAVKKGMLEARGEYCLFSDADLSTPIRELARMLDLAGQGYDVVIGSRVLRSGGETVQQPWYRRTMRFAFNKVVRALAVRGIADTQCGFKLFTREAAQALFSQQRLMRFGFDVEILYLARKKEFRIKEMPVSWFYSADTRMRYLSDGVKMVGELLRIRLNDLLGRYE